MKRRTSVVEERPGIPGAHHVGGIDDHQWQPARRQPQRHDLRLVLGVDVRDRVAAGVPDVRLIRGRPGGAGPIAATDDV